MDTHSLLLVNPWLPATTVLAFVVTLVAVPRWAVLARRAGQVGVDVHKVDRPTIPEMGGVPVLLGFMLGLFFYIAVRTFVFFDAPGINSELLAVLCTVLLAALIGLIDDLLGWKMGLGRWHRLALALVASFPLVAVNAGSGTLALPLGGELELGLLYPLVAVPAVVVISSNGFNIVAGFNGLEAGMGVIMLTALGIAAADAWVTVLSGIMVAALLAFLWYNRVPARVLPGNVLTYAVGGLLGAVAILGNAEHTLAVLFVPYLAEFLLKTRGGLRVESFAEPGPAGELNNLHGRWYGLTHVAVALLRRFGRATEGRVVATLWILELVFAVLAVALSR
jgi:UDP-N-acetylglucosamine--dolichyl-phosphate N-acetylglucosaminephosphotransferase